VFKYIFFLSLIAGIYLSATSTLFPPQNNNPFLKLSLESIDNDNDLFLSFSDIQQRRLKYEKQKQKAKAQERIRQSKRLEEIGNAKIARKKRKKEIQLQILKDQKIAKEKALEQIEYARIFREKMLKKIVSERIILLKQEAQKEAEQKALQESKVKSKTVKHMNIVKNVRKKKKYALVAKKNKRLLTAHIDLSQQKMYVYLEDTLLHKWSVSTARRGYVTPLGEYQPLYLERMHYSKKYHNSPMPYSIFFKGGYAVHGTNSLRQLGKIASHGCVRLHPAHAKSLYTLVRKYGKDNSVIAISR